MNAMHNGTSLISQFVYVKILPSDNRAEGLHIAPATLGTNYDISYSHHLVHTYLSALLL